MSGSTLRALSVRKGWHWAKAKTALAVAELAAARAEHAADVAGWQIRVEESLDGLRDVARYLTSSPRA